MRYLILILILLSFSCKSSKKYIQKDVQVKTEEIEKISETKGISSSFTAAQLLSSQLKVTRFEPIYVKLNGKDTVIFKETTYIQTDIVTNKEESLNIDTTSFIKESLNSLELTDKTEIKKEFKGFDILKSIIGGIIDVITGPFSWIPWIVGVSLIIPIYQFIKNKITKK
jgi:hypothetical protein